jgi:hypothetical protein
MKLLTLLFVGYSLLTIAAPSTPTAFAIASLTDPGMLNRAKSDKVTDRARVFAKELYDAKLLSEEVLLRP